MMASTIIRTGVDISSPIHRLAHGRTLGSAHASLIFQRGAGSLASVDILTISAPKPVAPAGVWFEAVDPAGFESAAPLPGAAYDPRFHQITYLWTIRGSPLRPYGAPENMVDTWNNPNRAWGRQVAFVFPEPGSYLVELRAIDRSGNVAVAETRITVVDSDIAYPGAQTICVSKDPGETWAGAPPGARRVQSPSELQAAIVRAAEPQRVLFRRGQSFNMPAIDLGEGPVGYVGAWGEGGRPTLVPSDDQIMLRLGRRSRTRQFTVANVNFRGGWDPTTETGRHPRSPFIWAQSPTVAHYTVSNCDIAGFRNVDTQVGELPSTVILADCRVTDWSGYGFYLWCPNARFAFIGMQIAQNPDALHGGGRGGVPANTQGPVRISDCAEVYIGVTDLFSRTGWSGLAGELADQPCLRLNTNGRRGFSANLDRIVAEGGWQVITITGARGRYQRNPGNYLIDKALLIGTAKTIGPFVSSEMGGLTMRNVIGILPDTPRKHPNRWQGAVVFEERNPGTGNMETPMTVHSSTFLSLLTPANRPSGGWKLEEGADAFSEQTLENNLLGQAERFDLGSSLPGIRPRFRGIRYNFEPQSGELSAAVPPRGAFAVTYAAITEDTVQRTGTAPTTPAYWQGLPASDRQHVLRVGRKVYHASRREIAVRFDPDAVRILNLSGEAWPAGERWSLRLDRKSQIPPMDDSYASPATLPLPRPAPGSQAAGGTGQGLSAYDDFLGSIRPALPLKGAIEPS